MSQLNAIHTGDLTIIASDNSTDQGYGDVSIARYATISGTLNSTSFATGTLKVAGGVGIAKDAWVNGLLDVNGRSYFDQVDIDTTDGLLSITGSNGVTANVTNAISLTSATTSQFTVSSGNLNLTSGNGTMSLSSNGTMNIESIAGGIIMASAGNSSWTVNGSYTLTLDSTAGRASLKSGANLSNAVLISAYNSGGGVRVSGGSQGIGLDASNGPINLTANGAASSFAFTADANAQDLTIALIASPSNNSKVNITSDGNTSGALTLLANNGGITMTAASSYSLTSGTSFNLSGTGASSGMALTSTADGNNLSIVLAGATDSKLRIISSGTNLDAIRMQSSAGGFDIDAVTSYTVDVSAGPISLDAIGASSNFSLASSSGGQNLTISQTGNNASSLILSAQGTGTSAIQLTASSGGIVTSAVSQFNLNVSSGPLLMNASGTASHILLATTGAGQDFTVGITGSTASRLILSSQGTGADAILINSTGGGLDMNVAGELSLDTSDVVNGIRIGTSTSGVPVTIGHSVSEVTIGQNLTVTGDMTVLGTQNIINTDITTYEDNVLLINSAPLQTADGGMVIKRFQRIDQATDDIVSDPVTETSGQHGGNSQVGGTANTIILSTGASAVNDYYKGYWIKITSGGGAGEVRKIKSYVGITKVATIYGVGETDGANWVTIPDNAQYELYGDSYIACVYDESRDEWMLAYCPQNAAIQGQVTPLKYLKLHVGDLDVDRIINVDTISEHTLNSGVTIEGITLKDNAITGLISINGNTLDVTEVVVLPDDNSTEVTINSTNLSGTFTILVKSILPNGACAIFQDVKASSATDYNNVTRVRSSKGSNNESIVATWHASGKIKLMHQTPPSTGNPTSYRVKVITV